MKFFISTLILALMLGACTQAQKETHQETLRVSIEYAKADSYNMDIPYVGVVEEEQATMVSFTAMAVLKSVKVSEGQFVQKGQLLAIIDDAQARNALIAAESALKQAKDAQTRMKQLYEKNSLPEMKWVEIESKVQQAQSSYEICKKNLEDCSVYSPCNGVVGSKLKNVGETVLPSEPILTILSINKVKVRVNIPEKEIAAITSDMSSIVTLDALPGVTFSGETIEKGVSADAATHTYAIRVLLKNPEYKLLPGMVAKVSLKMHSMPSIITLPVKAVQQSTDKTLFVWVVKEGKANRQKVTIGKTRGNRVIIESGLQEGMPVIVEGYQKVSDGTPVLSL